MSLGDDLLVPRRGGLSEKANIQFSEAPGSKAPENMIVVISKRVAQYEKAVLSLLSVCCKLLEPLVKICVVPDLCFFLPAGPLAYEKRILVGVDRSSGLVDQSIIGPNPSVFLELRASIEEMQSAMQKMNFGVMCADFALPHDIVGRWIIFVVSKTVVGGEINDV